MDKKVVIITGASSGIGLACAREFSRHGFKVVLAARSIEKLQVIKEEMLSFNSDILAIRVDVSIEEDCKLLINETIKHFGSIDILIGNLNTSVTSYKKHVCVIVSYSRFSTW